MKAQLIAFAAVASLDTNQEVPEKEEVRKRFYNKSQRVECGNDKEATERETFQSALDLCTSGCKHARICLSQP
jgi:hypothetical protein